MDQKNLQQMELKIKVLIILEIHATSYYFHSYREITTRDDVIQSLSEQLRYHLRFFDHFVFFDHFGYTVLVYVLMLSDLEVYTICCNKYIELQLNFVSNCIIC